MKLIDGLTVPAAGRPRGPKGKRVLRCAGRAWRRRAITWLRGLLLVSLLVPAIAAPSAAAAPATQLGDEQAIVGDGIEVGRHYRQTGAGTGLGYDVREPFFSHMRGLGGTDVIGFPVSAPFQGVDGCRYQAFQRVLLQQCPGAAPALANTFQILEEFGADPRLEQLGIGRGLVDNAPTFQDAVRIRLGWLEDPALRDRYLSDCGHGDPEAAIQFCGLPMTRPVDAGPFVSQRFQRIAFQRWITAGPAGIRPGDITAILGGDLLKELGVLTGPIVQPHATGQVPPASPVAFTWPAGLPVALPTAQPTPTTPTTAATPLVPTATPATATGTQRTIPLAYGFQADFFRDSERPFAIDRIRSAGFGWAKQQVRWGEYEISPVDCAANRANCLEATVNGRQKFFRRDRLGFLTNVINDINAAGLRLLVSVVDSPSFYAVPGSHAPANPDMLRDFVQFLVSTFRDRIHAVEPWNEQNLAGEWGGTRLWPNAPAAPPQGVVDFVALQRAAFQGIKAADPSVTVVLPALTPTGVGECWENPDARTQPFCLQAVTGAIDDRLYLDFLFQVNNGEIKSYYDVLGVHPSGYNNPPDDWVDRRTVPSASFKGHPSFYIKRYQQLRQVQLKHGDTKPMWFTEVGWSSTRIPVLNYEYGQDNSEQQRGRYVARLLEQVHDEAPYVTNVILWNLNFRRVVSETDEKWGFGLINPDGSATPGYTCAVDFVQSGNRITRSDCR